MSLLEDIINGKHDGEIDALYGALNQRQSLINGKKKALVMATVRVGDIGVLQNLRKHRGVEINGRQVKVVEKKRSRSSVQYTDPGAVFTDKLPFTIPASCFKAKV